jgi:putative peptidoglycan lipid II flippase
VLLVVDMGADVRGGCGSSADFGLVASGLKAGPAGFDLAVFMTRWMFPPIGFMSLVAARVSSTPGVDLPFRCDAGSAQSGGDFAAWLAPHQIQGIEPVYALAVVWWSAVCCS